MTTNIVDKDGNSIAAADATVPSDRLFRDAWTLSGSTITEDLTTAMPISGIVLIILPYFPIDSSNSFDKVSDFDITI